MTALNPHSSQTVTLWLKSEPFAIGALSSPPSPRLSVNVRCLIIFARRSWLFTTSPQSPVINARVSYGFAPHLDITLTLSLTLTVNLTLTLTLNSIDATSQCGAKPMSLQCSTLRLTLNHNCAKPSGFPYEVVKLQEH